MNTKILLCSHWNILNVKQTFNHYRRNFFTLSEHCWYHSFFWDLQLLHKALTNSNFFNLFPKSHRYARHYIHVHLYRFHVLISSVSVNFVSQILSLYCIQVLKKTTYTVCAWVTKTVLTFYNIHRYLLTISAVLYFLSLEAPAAALKCLSTSPPTMYKPPDRGIFLNLTISNRFITLEVFTSKSSNW